MEAVFSPEAFVTMYKTKPWYIQHTTYCLFHCLQEPAMELVLIQVNPIHILTLSAFQHAVLTRNISCSLTISAIGIDIKIDHSVLQHEEWVDCETAKFVSESLLSSRRSGQFSSIYCTCCICTPKSFTAYSLPAMCCHISRRRSPQSFI